MFRHNSYRALPSNFGPHHSYQLLSSYLHDDSFSCSTRKDRSVFLRKSDGQNQNFFLLSPFNLRPLFTFSLQRCGITPDDKISESLRPLIYPSDPLQHHLPRHLHLAEPKSSFLLTSLFKFLSHWADGFSSGTKHSPCEQTFLPICVQQPQQKWLPLLAKPPIIFPQTSQHA